MIEINDINYNSSIVLEIQKKDDFLHMIGEGKKDDDGDLVEAFVFKLNYGTHIDYYGFGEDICYIFRGDM